MKNSRGGGSPPTHPCDQLHVPRQVVGRQQVGDANPEELGDGVAARPRPGLVDGEQPSLEVVEVDGVDGVVEQLAVAGFGGGQALAGLPLGHEQAGVLAPDAEHEVERCGKERRDRSREDDRRDRTGSRM